MKPKRRFFVTKEEKRHYVEDYKRKIKTELCKNWELKGFCKYGDKVFFSSFLSFMLIKNKNDEKCCFAHGREELKEKTHLHSNYKTKPCKQYFFQGYCPYGYRCQYMHNEIKKSEEKTKEFCDFLSKAFQDKQIYINFLTKKNENARLNLKKFENLIKLDESREQIPSILRKRLPIFTKFSQHDKPNNLKGLIQKEKKSKNFSLII